MHQVPCLRKRSSAIITATGLGVLIASIMLMLIFAAIQKTLGSLADWLIGGSVAFAMIGMITMVVPALFEKCAKPPITVVDNPVDGVFAEVLQREANN
ncbi:MAG: hypothetical protein KC877_04095 [Candidatus Kaiserbacteria bacterium]|nr:hypothetical protein [Candidatus Kaiserbacteria bacterium]MCB9815802.1 hypothetical protein [Candidatus Nomurabacteria bacterium]